jgi:hypothetical protein
MVANDDRLPEILETGIRHDFRGRREDFLEFAAFSRVLLLVHDPTGLPVDLSLAGTTVELEAIELATRQSFGWQTVPFPRRSTSP